MRSSARGTPVPLADVFVRSGKVRDLYRVGEDRLLLVASDRLSAFDVVLPTPIPDKGRILTGLSRFWFAVTTDIVVNHLLSTDPADLPVEITRNDPATLADLRGRMMLGSLAEVLPVECVVRGYLSGSGWKEYRATGAVCGLRLPEGLREGDRLPTPIFTPAWKAPAGQHDENIDLGRVRELIGDDLAERVRTISLALYQRGAEICGRAGIILADTKFEFGTLPSGDLVLIDEVMTPDSSRFWDAAAWEPGRAQASYDKQFVRDWLLAQPWDQTAPGPELPDDVVAGTRARYIEAFERITGASFARYLMEDVLAP
jgi:phosphoribosylaminoimidazole-succinocarboxamide synthase